MKMSQEWPTWPFGSKDFGNMLKVPSLPSPCNSLLWEPAPSHGSADFSLVPLMTSQRSGRKTRTGQTLHMHARVRPAASQLRVLLNGKMQDVCKSWKTFGSLGKVTLCVSSCRGEEIAIHLSAWAEYETRSRFCQFCVHRKNEVILLKPPPLQGDWKLPLLATRTSSQK